MSEKENMLDEIPQEAVEPGMTESVALGSSPRSLA